MAAHPDAAYLANMKNVCRKMIIDGPNCVIGCLPDKTMFMVQDRKKLRPGVVGGRPRHLCVLFGDLRAGRRHPRA